MDNRKYIGMDVHQASISIAVVDAAGKLLMECIIETKTATVLEFIQGLRGSLWVTFEEGTSAAWLYDLLKPHVTKVVVCDPRRNALLKAGNKNDRVDARKLSDLLRAGAQGETTMSLLESRSRIFATVDLGSRVEKIEENLAAAPVSGPGITGLPDPGAEVTMPPNNPVPGDEASRCAEAPTAEAEIKERTS